MTVRFRIDERGDVQKKMVYLVITEKGKQKLYATNIRVPKDCWDKAKKQVKNKHPYYLQLNLMLSNIDVFINGLQIDAMNGVIKTRDKFDNEIKRYFNNLKFNLIEDSIPKLNIKPIKHNITEPSIYIMHDLNTNYCKIGYSKNPQYREKTLQSEKPTIKLLFSYKGNRVDEAFLHKHFKSKRIRGEWFNLDTVDIQSIINYLYKGTL